jgi:GntR family transcriptional regulator
MMIPIKLTGAMPLYEQIKAYILQGIQDGRYRPGERIPSERELADQLGVSRLTVHHAIKGLQQAGVLVAQVGRGTFVSPRPLSQQLEALTSFSEDMRSRGNAPSSRVLSARVYPAPDDIARFLDVRPGTQLAVLRRVRLADDQPMALETSHIVASQCPGIIERYDFERDSLYRVLRQEYGLVLAHAEQTIAARGATRDEAGVLGLKPNAPVLHMTRVLYTANDRPLEYVISAYRGDLYTFHVVLRQV